MSFFPKFRPANRPPLGRESPRPAAFEVLAPERMVVMLPNVVSAVYVMTVAKPSKGESRSVFQSSDCNHQISASLSCSCRRTSTCSCSSSRSLEKTFQEIWKKHEENMQLDEIKRKFSSRCCMVVLRIMLIS